MPTVFCHHVYQNTGFDICPACGKDTHEIDWNVVHEQHKDWIASGKAVAQGWWSI